jgi:hypothetical protein
VSLPSQLLVKDTILIALADASGPPGRQKPDTTQTCRFENKRYINAVNYLTKQEQMVLIIVLGLLFIGWTIKAYRTAHPSTVAVQPVKP